MNVELNLTGMHCGSCALDVKETLEETAGVRAAQVSYADKQAVVDFDDRIVQESTLIKKIQDLGYQATVTKHE